MIDRNTIIQNQEQQKEQQKEHHYNNVNNNDKENASFNKRSKMEGSKEPSPESPQQEIGEDSFKVKKKESFEESSPKEKEISEEELDKLLKDL